MLGRRWLTRRRALVGGAAILLLLVGITWLVTPSAATYTTDESMVTVRSGPGDSESITLDTTLFLPTGASAGSRVPAVLLAHGFGGTKTSVEDQAADFADQGYAVLIWTARGFGKSTGEIHLDAPDYEVRDAQKLLDWLAARPEIQTDAAGDPKVGVVGGSYGGALALMLSAADPRVDAIVPMITWNDLANSFLPESTGAGPEQGVFKKAWAGVFFGNSSGRSDIGSPGPRYDAQCGRFAADICAAYLRIASTGRADADAVALLRRSSPQSVIDKIKAPTLLVQGEADTLFPLSEADANARGISRNGTPVRVAWFTGGHDGGLGTKSDQDRVNFLTIQWLDHYVRKEGETPATSFTYSRINGLDAVDRGLMSAGFSVTDYPGTGGQSSTALPLGRSIAQDVANPPDGTPAAISALPGAGLASTLLNGVSVEVPGQNASFLSAELAKTMTVVGSPTVSVRAASPTGDAVLFVKLYDVGPDGQPALINSLVSPIRLTGLPKTIDTATPVKVTLPAIVREIESGHHLAVVLATSDQGYAGPPEPVVYRVEATGDITLPTVAGEPIQTADVLWRWILVGLLALLAIGLVAAILIARMRGRKTDVSVDPDLAGTPLQVRNLRKEYGNGFVAVADVSFTVERGQVVGLLGPNGAGKTTSLRVLMGLTRPTSGEISVFGHKLTPGSPVLSRIGSLVEGPGFLPHLNGEQNLKAYWRATGRAWEDAHFDEAVAIAGLGDSIHRRVKTYSHGMKQRLAIAQAMLGLPELLVLDEPTDGLDPPQIAEMRRVLGRYATDGRAVLVSSHLLAEVEQTCSHVVVVHRGQVVASGKVDEIVGDTPTTVFEVSDLDLAQRALDKLHVPYAVESERTLVVQLDHIPRSEAVAALVNAGVGVDRVAPRRRLEDAFLALVGDSTAGSGDR
ncbi:ABC-2 type transport system ATP-binding protein [Allocatelliglobosispora scoriae]|uniref:ABC-2 type transport system ATP-binding protein n=1 Tax=Allocatelliglobosispora scoriae TaxID=643052 RepID=A0A841BR09_9ACTN|nr:CocE/NonD family hydrolase [Allocatelliglobosispora scoriae]MBB5870674.1 ABC-2 type transport system ATP-binding protein [Allocatelliglobosispora scoriae]